MARSGGATLLPELVFFKRLCRNSGVAMGGKCAQIVRMKRRNISLDEEAYRILQAHKLKGETWSDVVKKQVAEPLEGPALVTELKRIYRGAKHEAVAR